MTLPQWRLAMDVGDVSEASQNRGCERKAKGPVRVGREYMSQKSGKQAEAWGPPLAEGPSPNLTGSITS